LAWFKRDPLQIIPFQSYGTASHFHIRGRALEDEIIDLSQKSYFNLFINSWKRFESDEIKHTSLSIRLPNQKKLKVVTDSHGYYHVEETINGLDLHINEEGWLKYEVSYDDDKLKRNIQQGNRFQGELLIPSNNSSFGVISDIDDTILHTGVVSSFKWQVVYNTIFMNASKRSALHGAADFYQRLHRGKTGSEANPLFYVSHSPWNLYRYLEHFLSANDFPKGPILLRSFKTILKRKGKDEKPQKQKEILSLLKTYPQLEFILIGDSGERDPFIYMELANEFPKRIKAIYLRSVAHKKKMAKVMRLLDNNSKVEALIVDDSSQAIEHARQHGWIE
jgi:phosphatidate phosphatase APP1